MPTTNITLRWGLQHCQRMVTSLSNNSFVSYCNYFYEVNCTNAVLFNWLIVSLVLLFIEHTYPNGSWHMSQTWGQDDTRCPGDPGVVSDTRLTQDWSTRGEASAHLRSRRSRPTTVRSPPAQPGPAALSDLLPSSSAGTGINPFSSKYFHSIFND